MIKNDTKTKEISQEINQFNKNLLLKNQSSTLVNSKKRTINSIIDKEDENYSGLIKKIKLMKEFNNIQYKYYNTKTYSKKLFKNE